MFLIENITKTVAISIEICSKFAALPAPSDSLLHQIDEFCIKIDGLSS